MNWSMIIFVSDFQIRCADDYFADKYQDLRASINCETINYMSYLTRIVFPTPIMGAETICSTDAFDH